MKSLILVATALAVGRTIAAPSDSGIAKRQNALAGIINSIVNPQGGRVPAPPGSLPGKIDMPVRTKANGAKTIKMRYGPYKVPNMGIKSIIGEEGALWNYADNKVEKPCDECVIVGINAGLEYPDGKNANVDTGMWLHHMVLFSQGPGRTDATCLNAPGSMPHMIVGSTPRNSERLFSSGNERTHAIMPLWNEDNVGYKLKTTDKFALIVDLMNDNMEDKVVFLTITYDIVPGNPAGYDDMKPVWFDVAQCLTSEWTPPYEEGNYTIPSTIWTANFDGEILGAAGHLHDGGQSVRLAVDGKQVCKSDATYGGSPEFVSTSSMGGHGDSATVHISKMSLCVGDTLAEKKMIKGQRWKLRADYDYNKAKGSKHGAGKQSNVMGIAIMFVRVKS